MPLNDTVQIPLRRRDGSVRAYAIVDAVDAEWVNKWRWNMNAGGYARRQERISDGTHRNILMHRALLNITDWDGLEGDHVNRDTLDNRRENLRVVTHAQNGQNRRWNLPASVSRFRGVTWHHVDKKWCAKLKINGKSIFVGYFDSEELAGTAALEARQRLMPWATD